MPILFSLLLSVRRGDHEGKRENGVEGGFVGRSVVLKCREVR